jgi:hypothetical protein
MTVVGGAARTHPPVIPEADALAGAIRELRQGTLMRQILNSLGEGLGFEDDGWHGRSRIASPAADGLGSASGMTGAPG